MTDPLPMRFVHPHRPGEVRTANTASDSVRLRFDGWQPEPEPAPESDPVPELAVNDDTADDTAATDDIQES